MIRTCGLLWLGVGLALSACGSAKEPAAPPGVMEEFAAQHERDAAAAKIVARRDADARAVVRADADFDRYDAAEKKRASGG